ncbi:MAG: hypothetical protein D6698_01080 [Gammaproteobacteria bacterium]|nr:MAG: hypothetical protein D6698_01080 [Gammaproteobacteria bacterium]
MKSISKILAALLTGLFLLFSSGIGTAYAAAQSGPTLLLAHDDHDEERGWSSRQESESHSDDDGHSSSHHGDHGQEHDNSAGHRRHDNTLYWLKMISYVVGIAIGIVVAGGG